MDWSKSYTMSLRLMTVDRDTWADGEEYGKVRSISINRNSTDSVPLIETASIAIDQDINEEFEEQYMRIEAAITQDNSTIRVPLMTALVMAANGNLEYVESKTLSGYSVLKPADRTVVPKGFYAPKGSDGAECVKELLVKGGVIAPIRIDGSFELSSHIVFDLGATYLSCAWDVLDAAGWCMMISEEGEITIANKPTDPVLVIDNVNAGMLENAISYDLDYTNVPNRYYVVDGSTTYVAVNQDQGRTSVDARQGYVDYMDDSPTYIDNESIDYYARRRLEEESTLVKKYSYTRKYYPGVLPFTKVQANLGSTGFDGELRVLTQSIEMENGLRVKETAGFEIKEYVA